MFQLFSISYCTPQPCRGLYGAAQRLAGHQSACGEQVLMHHMFCIQTHTHTRVYNYSYSSFYLLGQKRKRVFISAYEFCLFFSSNSLPHPFGGEGQKEEQKAVWCLDACWVKPQQLSMHTQQKNIMSNLSFQ